VKAVISKGQKLSILQIEKYDNEIGENSGKLSLKSGKIRIFI